MARGGMMVAVESGCTEIEGEPVTFVAGVTKVRANHALVKANPGYWKPVDESVTYDDGPEQATAAPGEKRGARRAKAGAGSR